VEEDRFLVVFTGRPNAGKSSLIRALTGLRVAVGKRPGTTTRIKVYPVSKGLGIVDMPGYGVKVGAPRAWVERTKDAFLEFIEDNAGRIKAAVHVLSLPTFLEAEERLAKKGYINVDVEMVGFLQETLGVTPLVAANKVDKVSEEEAALNLEALRDRLENHLKRSVEHHLFPVSARTGQGVGPLKEALVKKLREAGYRGPLSPRR